MVTHILLLSQLTTKTLPQFIPVIHTETVYTMIQHG